MFSDGMSVPIVCYVTDRKSPDIDQSAGSVLHYVRAAIQVGVDWVQIREKDLPARELYTLVREAVEMSAAQAEKVRVIVNDRLDVAIAAEADGVHLRGDSMDMGEVIRWCRKGNAPAEFLVGISCHSVEEVREAQEAGASYAFWGPVFDTPSKRSFGSPQGTGLLAEACRGAEIPVIAIGGVNDVNAPECIRAGAAGIAAIRLFQQPHDPMALQQTVKRLHDSAV